MSPGLIGDGEFAQVVASHLELDFHLTEALALADDNYLLTKSSRMITTGRCVFTTSGFSMGHASSLVLSKRIGMMSCFCLPPPHPSPPPAQV